jgi:hypothetical protein
MKKIIMEMVFMLMLSNTCVFSKIMRVKTEAGDEDHQIENIKSFYFIDDEKHSEIESVEEMNFGTLNCNTSYKDTVITIKNIGNDILAITHIDIFPKEEFSFITPPNVVMGLEPDEEYQLSIRYSPNYYNVHEEKLRITSNAKNGIYYDISLKGEKIESDYSILVDTLDFGKCCDMQGRDTLINIINNASMKNIITVIDCPDIIILDNYQFDLVDIKKLQIALNTSIISSPGVHSDFIVFRDECGKEKTITVKYEISNPDIAVDDIELESELTSSSIKELTIENKSDEEFVMTSYKFDNNSFSFEDVNLPYVIPAKTTIDLKVKFRPKNSQTAHGKLKIFSYCNFSKEIALTGKVKIFLINDGFEWYPEDSFPYSGGWDIVNYSAPADSQKVTTENSYSGDKCLRGWGVWGLTPSISSALIHELSVQPDVIYCECAAMIDRIGFIHIGLASYYNNYFTTYATVDFSNHAHFYYSIGTGGAVKEGRWANDPYAPFVWYKIKFKLDYINKEMSIWINDEFVKKDNVSTFPLDRYQFFYVRTAGGYADEGNGYYDDVKVWYYSE